MARVQRIERARRPQPSPIAVLFGGFDRFEAHVRAQVDAGTLDRREVLGDGGVLAALAQWEREGLYAAWKRSGTGVWSAS